MAFKISLLHNFTHFNSWRNSFLFSLLFGIPVMITMAYFMITMATTDCGEEMVTEGNSTMEDQMDMDSEHCMKMVMPGLSLENLLLFLLCTPCQVGDNPGCNLNLDLEGPVAEVQACFEYRSCQLNNKSIQAA